MFTSGERQKLALRSKAGSYFSVSFPQVAPYKTEQKRGQKAEPGSRPKGKQMPWEPASCHRWEAAPAGNKRPHSCPWGRTATSPSPAHISGFMDARRERERKGWGDEGPTVGQRGESKDPPRRAWVTALWKSHAGMLFRSPQKPEKPAHPSAHSCRSPTPHVGHPPGAKTTDALAWAGCTHPALWFGDSPDHTTGSHSWLSSVLGTG